MDTSEEDRQILVMLRDALRYADEVDGQVPTEHLDYVYDLVVTHIKGQGTQEKEHLRRKRQKGTGRTKYKRYIYARTQDLFNKDPGQLAKLVREDVSWLEEDVGQLPTTEKLYKNLWESIAEVDQPFSGELGGEQSQLDIHDIITTISRNDRGRTRRHQERSHHQGEHSGNPQATLRTYISVWQTTHSLEREQNHSPPETGEAP